MELIEQHYDVDHRARKMVEERKVAFFLDIGVHTSYLYVAWILMVVAFFRFPPPSSLLS